MQGLYRKELVWTMQGGLFTDLMAAKSIELRLEEVLEEDGGKAEQGEHHQQQNRLH